MIALLAAALIAPADLVIENARIWTDGRVGFADFAAVSQGRFVYVGDRNPAYVGPKTLHVDAKGRVVLPGLIDSHAHMLGGGLNLAQIQLRDAKSKQEFVQRVADWAKSLSPGKWILGGRWSVESWAVREQPTKEWIDPVTQGHPLFLSRMDGHSGLANSSALKLAGIARNTASPAGGVIDKDASGEPTGILRERAMDLVTRHIPARTLEEQVSALEKAIDHANRLGITAVSDIPGIEDLPVYTAFIKRGRPSIRLSIYPVADDWTTATAQSKAFNASIESSHLQDWLRVRGFKAYFDGSLGSRTAYMREPYLGNPPEKKDWRGLPMPIVENGVFLKNAKAAHALGFQAIVHAIGDEANNMLLNQLFVAYGADLMKARCRSEHAQHLLPGDIPRFGRIGVIASMQPYHKADDGRYAEDYLGPERVKSSYAFKSLLDEGVVVAFGSDWPVVSMNPFLGIQTAVTGRTLDGKLWQTQENLTIAEALRGYTTRGAYAMFMDDDIGRIEQGFHADFVIMDRSPFDRAVEWEAISPTEVYVEGRRVYPK